MSKFIIIFLIYSKIIFANQLLDEQNCSKAALLLATGKKTALTISLECDLKKEKNLFWILPTRGFLRFGGTLSTSLFQKLNQKTFPEKMPGEGEYYPEHTLKYISTPLSVSLQFRSLEEGKRSFEEIEEYLKRYKLKADPKKFQKYIEAGWSFSIFSIKGKGGKGGTVPIWIELPAEGQKLPAGIFKSIPRVDFYILSPKEFKLKPLLHDGKLTTIEREFTRFSQGNRVTLLSHLGGEVEEIYQKLIKGESVKRLYLYHLYRRERTSRGKEIIDIVK